MSSVKINRILKFILDEFVYGGHITSLGAVGIVFILSLLFNIKITLGSVVVVYLWTYSVYLFNRFKELDKDLLNAPFRVKYINKNKKLIPLFIFFSAVIPVVILLYYNKILALLFGSLLFVLSLFYTISWKKVTKKIPAFKSFFVSLIWSLIVIFFIFYFNLSIKISFVLVVIFLYFRYFIHEELFNLEDTKGDKKENYLTMAIIMGKKKLINTLHIINILSAVPILLGIYFNILPVYSFGLLLAIPYGYYYLNASIQEKKRKTFIYNAIIDIELIALYPFLLIIKFIIQ